MPNNSSSVPIALLVRWLAFRAVSMEKMYWVYFTFLKLKRLKMDRPIWASRPLILKL